MLTVKTFLRGNVVMLRVRVLDPDTFQPPTPTREPDEIRVYIVREGQPKLPVDAPTGSAVRIGAGVWEYPLGTMPLAAAAYNVAFIAYKQGLERAAAEMTIRVADLKAVS